MGALEASRDTETGQDRRPPGRRLFRNPRWSGELGWPWRIRGLGRPWRSGELGWPWWDRLRDRGPSPRLSLFGRSPTTPQKISLGKIWATSGTWWRKGSADSWGRSGSVDSWGRSGSADTWGRSESADPWGRSGSADT